jgi:hypothetical protein
MKCLIKGVFCMALPALGIQAHAQQRVPAADDMQAAYCIRHFEAMVADFDGLISRFSANEKVRSRFEEERRLTSTRLNRLQLYFASRVADLDAARLQQAAKQAEEDGIASKAYLAACVKKCVPPPEGMSCAQGCYNNEHTRRLMSCNSLAFVPN